MGRPASPSYTPPVRSRGGQGSARGRRFLVLASIWIGACQDPASRPLLWPEGVDLAVLLRGHAEALELVATVAPGDETSAPRPLSLDAERAEELSLLGWSREALLQALPRLDRERWAEIQARMDLEACPGGAVASEQTRRHPLGDVPPRRWVVDAEVLSFVPADLGLAGLERVSLEAPLPRRLCEGLRPVRVERLDDLSLPSGVIIEGLARAARSDGAFSFHELVRLDPDRVVVQSPARLLHLTRGAVYGDAPSEFFPAHRLPSAPPRVPGGGAWELSALALDPTTRGRPVQTLLAAGIHRLGGGGDRVGGGVFEIDVDAAGFVGTVRTATVFWGGRGFPDGLAADPDGGWVAVGSEGLVVRKAPGRAEVERTNLSPFPWFRRIIARPEPPRLHLAGSEDGLVVTGDLRGPLESLTVERPGSATTSIRGLALLRGPSSRWVVTTFASGAFEQQADGAWTRLGFQSMGASGCASTEGECGRRTLGAGPLASAGPNQLYAFSDRCGDLTVVDLSYGCARAVPLQLERASEMNADFGVLTVISDQGAVLELVLEP